MKVHRIRKITGEPWINLFKATCMDSDENGEHIFRDWIFASRKKEIKLEPDNEADAVIIVPYHYDSKKRCKLVLIKEFRIPIRDFEIGFPAGLIDEGETPAETATRELYEETGLNVTKVIRASKPIYSSAGMTDESVVMVFVECEGEIKENNGTDEKISAQLYSWEELYELYYSNAKFGAKCWIIIDSIINKGVIK